MLHILSISISRSLYLESSSVIFKGMFLCQTCQWADKLSLSCPSLSFFFSLLLFFITIIIIIIIIIITINIIIAITVIIIRRLHLRI